MKNSFHYKNICSFFSLKFIEIIKIIYFLSAWVFLNLLASDSFFALACFFLRLIIRKILFELEEMLKWSINEVSDLSKKRSRLTVYRVSLFLLKWMYYHSWILFMCCLQLFLHFDWWVQETYEHANSWRALECLSFIWWFSFSLFDQLISWYLQSLWKHFHDWKWVFSCFL